MATTSSRRRSFDPDHPECAAVIAEVWTLSRRMHHRDAGQAAPSSRGVPSCLRQYGIEERVKRLIATKCSGDKAPDRCVSGCASRSARPPSSAARAPRPRGAGGGGEGVAVSGRWYRAPGASIAGGLCEGGGGGGEGRGGRGGESGESELAREVCRWPFMAVLGPATRGEFGRGLHMTRPPGSGGRSGGLGETSGVGPLTVVGLRVLAVALLTATLGHDVLQMGQIACLHRLTTGACDHTRRLVVRWTGSSA